MKNSVCQRIREAKAHGCTIYADIGARHIPVTSPEEPTVGALEPVRFCYLDAGLPITVIRCTGRTWRETRDEIRREMRGSKRRVA